MREAEHAKLTFTTLSQPQDTMTGATGFGLNRTQDTLQYNIKITSLVTRRLYSPVCVSLILDIKLALSQSVPQFDSPVTRSRNNLPVVC